MQLYFTSPAILWTFVTDLLNYNAIIVGVSFFKSPFAQFGKNDVFVPQNVVSNLQFRRKNSEIIAASNPGFQLTGERAGFYPKDINPVCPFEWWGSTTTGKVSVFLKNGPNPVSFCLFLFLSNKMLQKIVDFSGTQTHIVRVEGEHNDHHHGQTKLAWFPIILLDYFNKN